MRSLAVRRHSLRARGDDHLSAAGRALAERVARADGPYDRAVSSPAERALETVRAMGRPVDRVEPELGPLAEGVEAALGPVSTWAECAVAIARRPTVARAAARFGAAIERASRELPEGARGLVVAHAMVVELAVAAVWPAAPFLAWGPACGCLEGAELVWEQGRVVGGRALRVVG